MENLISLLENEKVSKEELISAIDQIKFCTAFKDADEEIENDLPAKECNRHLLDQRANSIEHQLAVKPTFPCNDPDLKAPSKKGKHMQGYSRNKCISTGTLLTTNELTSYTGSKQDLACILRDTTSSHKSLQQQDFWSRHELYKTRKEMNQKNRATQIKEQEAKECSFKPKLNIQPIILQGFSSKKSAERLHSEAKKKAAVQKLRAQVKEKELTDMAENCTFRPAINSTSTDPRYMEISNNFLRDDSLRTGEVECTFSPEVNKIKKLTKQFSEYLNIDPYTRLFHGRNEKTIKHFETVRESKMSPQDANIIRKNFNEFHKRQLQFELKKQTKKEDMLKATKVDPTPKINKKSQELAKNISKRKQKTSSAHTLHDKKAGDLTFRPEILPESRKREGKTLDEMTYMPILLKQQRLSALRESLNQEPQSAVPVRAQCKAGEGKAESRLKLLDCVDTLMERIRREKLSSKSARNFKKRLKENKEMAECTHRPAITKPPKPPKSPQNRMGETRRAKCSYSKKDLSESGKRKLVSIA